MPQENSVLVQLRALMAQDEAELRARSPQEAEITSEPVEVDTDFDELLRFAREDAMSRGVDLVARAEAYERGEYEVRRDDCKVWGDYEEMPGTIDLSLDPSAWRDHDD